MSPKQKAKFIEKLKSTEKEAFKVIEFLNENDYYNAALEADKLGIDYIGLKIEAITE